MKTIIKYINEAKQSFRIKSHLKKDDQFELVDLDLPSGKKWAACNVGANKPEEYGDYFSWGETETKDRYDWDNYKYGTKRVITKYNDGNKQVLDDKDDIVYKLTNGKLKIPSREDFEELRKNTNAQNSRLNGIKGKKFISTKDKNKYIFIPYSDCKWQNEKPEYISAGLWTSTNDTSINCNAWAFDIGKDWVSFDVYWKAIGYTIRGISN